MNKHLHIDPPNPRILIAEDSPTQAAQIVHFLSRQGFAVHAARNGEEAYELAVATQPDILISDIVMPGMDGYELCRRLKATPGLEDTPVILVTSLSQPQDVLAGLEAGADNFIIKPYDEEVLSSRITYLLKNRNLRRAERSGDQLEVDFGGERHHITARKQQILDLLISTYAQAVHLFSALDQGRQELSQSYEVLHALYDMTDGLNRCRTPADVAMTTVSRSIGMPGVRDAWIYLRDDDGLRLTAQRHTGRSAQPDPFPPSPADAELADDTLGDVPQTRRVETSGGAARHHASMRLRVGARTFGFLNLVGSEPAVSGEVALRTLAAIASQVSIALERAILHTDLENEVRKRTQRLVEEVEERRQATETITAIFNASPVALISLDAQLSLTTWNRTATEIFRADSALVSGNPWFTLFTAAPTRLHDVMGTLQSGGEISSLEVDATLHDAAPRSLHIAGEPLIDTGGVFRGAVLAIDDITAIKQVKEQLHQAQKMEAVGNLTGGIAHDFNNLLTTIIGNLDLALIKSTEECAQQRPYLDTAMRASLRGSELARKLLAFARKQPLEPQALEPSAIMDEMRLLLDGRLGPHIGMMLAVAPDVPMVYADPVQLESALMNLAINARDAMPAGGELTIEVGFVPAPPCGRRAAVEFTVRDTGIGIPPEQLDRIFEPFFTTKEMGKGTGLGLAMVYGFASQSGGYLTVESEVGIGTTFRLGLPALLEQVAPDARPDEGRRPAAHEPRTVLLVEPNPEVRLTVENALIDVGHEVRAAGSAAEALRVLNEEGRVDVLLTDLNLADMDGLALARAVLEAGACDQVLLMCAAAPEAMASGETPERYGILNKPFRVEELRDAIAALF
jgi:PAS domain S-box-containing protein